MAAGRPLVHILTGKFIFVSHVVAIDGNGVEVFIAEGYQRVLHFNIRQTVTAEAETPYHQRRLSERSRTAGNGYLYFSGRHFHSRQLHCMHRRNACHVEGDGHRLVGQSRSDKRLAGSDGGIWVAAGGCIPHAPENLVDNIRFDTSPLNNLTHRYRAKFIVINVSERAAEPAEWRPGCRHDYNIFITCHFYLPFLIVYIYF